MNSSHSQQVAYEAALQSFVLLKNSNNALPLRKGAKLAVVGPMSNTSQGLISDYEGAQMCHDGSYDCMPTIA